MDLLRLDDPAAHGDGWLVAVLDDVEVAQLCVGLSRAAAAVGKEGGKHRLAVHEWVVDPTWELGAG